MGLCLGMVANAPTGREIGFKRRKARFSPHYTRRIVVESGTYVFVDFTVQYLFDPTHVDASFCFLDPFLPVTVLDRYQASSTC
jgi:hypothetical protein